MDTTYSIEPFLFQGRCEGRWGHEQLYEIPHEEQKQEYMYMFISFFYIRGNQVADLQEIDKLKCLPMLRAIVLTG